MKKVLLAAAVALVCSTGFAQAPAAGGTTSATAAEVKPQKDAAGDKAQMKVEAKKAAMPMAGAGGGHDMMMAMDTNSDGMVSRAEWDAYHGSRWSKMKLTNGMANQASIDAMMKGGPN
jgi:hypothetical protein